MTSTSESKTGNESVKGGVYLICVLEGQTEPTGLSEIKGIGDKPLRSIPFGNLQAIVSDVESKPHANRDNLLRHAAVLDQLLKFGQMLPARFGLLPDSENDVLENFLKPNSQEFEELLKKLHGKREVDLKIYWDNNAVLQNIVQANERIGQLKQSL